MRAVSPGPQVPGAERRRQLREQRRQEWLRNLWRLLLLSAAAAGLGYGLLRQGSSLQDPAQVEVRGSDRLSREQVIRAAGLHFPVPLLSLDPRWLRSRLAAALPVEQVQVERLLLPPRLRIELVDREAVARAQRRTATGIELGYVDRLGHWISRSQQYGGSVASKPEPVLMVLGWQEGYRGPLSQVLARRNSLGSPLQEIRFEPTGTLWLVTGSLGQVRLGAADDQLNRRLDVLHYLSAQLPSRMKGRSVQSIDLSDPDEPELGLPPGGGSRPRGGAAAGVD